MTRRGAGRERPGRELDDEGARAGEATVLPARGSARRNGKTAVAHSRQPCVEVGGLLALRTRAHERLRLVEPDRKLRADPQDQSPCDPRLGLRERLRARVRRIPPPAERPPAGGEIAIEVDTARVLADAEPESVRVELVHDPQVGVRRRRPGRQKPRHGEARTLVAVDAAHDEDAALARGLAELERTDRAAAHGVPKQLAPLDGLGGGERQSYQRLDEHDRITGP
jgi:hypothetical protein